MNKNNKRRYLLVLGPLLLVIALIGVTYAFFNYTRTGSPNTIQVGRIAFNSTQNNTISLENVFPTSSNNLNNTNSDTVTINITGDTTYSEGIEYKVTLEDVNNTINDKEVPISFNVTANNLGTKSSNYYSERGSTTNVYNLMETGVVEEDKYILVGYIKPDDTGVNGSIDITAYIDASNIAISDTVSRIEDGNLVYGETPGDWIAGRTVLTTTEWNSLTGNNAISFKVRVEANEGIWVEEPKIFVMKNLFSDSNWRGIRANITSIEFHSDGLVPSNPVSTINATDVTSKGAVTVYAVDDGLGHNTYKAIVVADNTIYAPVNSLGMFMTMTNLVEFDSNNFKIDNVTNMFGLFTGCANLVNINSLSSWNISHVTNMQGMFSGCTNLDNIDALINWDTSSVTSMQNMFANCLNLADIDGLINWNTLSVKNIDYMFQNCTNLVDIDGVINWNMSHVTNMQGMFDGCTNLANIDALINWNTSNVEYMKYMFKGCTNLTDVSALKNWNTSSVTDMSGMFNGCSKLTSVDLNSWNMLSVVNNNTMFQQTGFTSINMPNNYTRIDDFMFNHNDSYTGESFTIPKSVTSVGKSHIFYNFGKDNVFKKFIVESGNTSLKTIDDILYTYDGTRLISVPRGKTFTNNTYEIPEGITFMNELSFSRNRNIETVILPNSYVIERYIKANNNSYGFINSGNSLSVAVYLYTSISRYEVKNDNPRYMSYDGCIYSKDGTELIAVPLHYTGVLNIKSGTTTIGQEAFWTVNGGSSIDSITRINIPASVTTIEANQLTTLNSLMSRSTNPVTITIDSGNTAYQISGNKIVAK